MSDNVLTPNDVSLLMYYYVFPEPHPEQEKSHVRKATENLRLRGLVEESSDGWVVTDKGNVHVKTLCETELPVQRWIKKPEGGM